MLDKLRPFGYVRPTHEAEEDEFGRGFVAVLDDDDVFCGPHIAQAHTKLAEMLFKRTLAKDAQK